MATSTVALVEQLEALAKHPDNIDQAIRDRLQSVSRQLSIALESPGVSIHRIGSTVCL